MKTIAILAAAFLSATPASAQSVNQKSGGNSAPNMAPDKAEFVKQVAISDMLEIESSKLAQERADASSKAFAARMIKDHTGTSTGLNAIAGKEKIELPSAMDSAHQSKAEKL